jgi:nucleoside-diphosphate-sugar epimerase
MNIFVAGGTGAIGRYLVPLLVDAGHKVVALSRSVNSASQLVSLGALPVYGDVYDQALLTRLVAESEAEIVIQQLTAFGTKTGDPYAETMRVRIEGTRSLIAAARAAGARRFIAQSISFVCRPFGTGLTNEETPLYLDSPSTIRAFVESVASLERQTMDAKGMSGTVLRYGWFYGPGTSWDPSGFIPCAIREGTYPIVGSGAGSYSFINLRDAAAATVSALANNAAGIYNIVDDSPVRLSDWLPFAAKLLGAPPPKHEDVASARERVGDLRIYYMNEQRGASNAKAKRAFNWQPAFPSWRAGFEALYLNRTAQSRDAV